MPDIPNKEDIQGVNEELGYLEDQLLSIADRLSSTIKDAIEGVKDAGKGVGEVLADQVNKEIKNLSKGLNKTLQNTESLYKGTLKVSDVQKQITDRQLKRLSIERNLDTLMKSGVILEKDKLKAISELNEAEDAHNALLKDQLNLAQKIQKNMGVTGNLIKGINKIPILGDLINSEKALTAAQKAAAAEGSNRFKVMSATFKSLGGSLLKSLSDPLVIIGLLAKGIKSLVGLAGEMAKRSADIGKSFLNLAGSSNEVRNNLMEMAKDDPFMNFDEAVKHMQSINDLTGTAIMLTKGQTKEMQRLTDQLGISEEMAAKLFKSSALMGQPFEDSANQIKQVTDELNATEGQAISLNDVMDKFVNASAQVQSNLGNNPKMLAAAAFQAAKLGLNLSQIQSAAEGTLNFEDSIGKEMQAELMLGKQLNLEELRRAALSGDVLKQGEEIEKIIKQNIKSTEGNVLKQKALADTLNISVEEMFKINDEMRLQDKLAKMGISKAVTLASYNKAALKKQKELSKETGTQVSLEKAKLALSANDLKQLENQAKASQGLDRAFENIKESFLAGLVKSGAIDKINGLIKNFVGGGGMEKIGNLIAKAAGFLGSFINGMINNPKATLGGLALALGGVFLAQKMIPQLVSVVGFGGKGISSLTKVFSKKASSSALKIASKTLSTKQIAAGFGGKVAKDQLAKQGGKAAGKSAAIIGGKAAGKSSAKLGAKLGAKAIGKSLLKKIPGIGLLAGIGFGLQRAMKGDFAGAALELASGAVSLVPGFGTAASIAIDAGLAAKDISKAMDNGKAMDGDKTVSPSTAADFISRPGQPIQKFRADDLIVGGTNLGGNDNKDISKAMDVDKLLSSSTIDDFISSSIPPSPPLTKVLKTPPIVKVDGNNTQTVSSDNNNEVVMLLKELISEVRKGGDVYMDGNKVGRSIALATSNLG